MVRNALNETLSPHASSNSTEMPERAASSGEVWGWGKGRPRPGGGGEERARK